jgi:tetratricopeptide (TPR) repeat protein
MVAMLRLLAFALGVLAFHALLQRVPVVGPFFRGTGLFGLWIAAILLSLLFTRIGARLVRSRRSALEIGRLAAVGSAANRGKIGALLLADGRARAALSHLEAARAGEPDVAEWHARAGQAHLALRARDEAQACFERALQIDPEHGYGRTRMQLAALHTRAGRREQALAELGELESRHGPSAESACRRGRILARLGERAGARAAFAEPLELAARAPRYQRARAEVWAWRARFSSVLG